MRWIVLVTFLVALAGACSDSSGGDSAVVPSQEVVPVELDIELDAPGLIAASLEATNAVDSYHVRFSTTLHPQDVRGESVWEFEVSRPEDSYRYVLHSEAGESEEVCEFEGHGRACRDVVTKVTERSLFEGLYVDDFAYGRQCNENGNDCGEWERNERPETPIFGPSPSYLPQWPLVALELIENPEPARGARINGVDTVRIRGNVQLQLAVLESQRRLLEGTGITSFGQSCTSRPPEAGSGTSSEGSATNCRDLTFEESLAKQEGIAEQRENPPTVDVWIGLEDSLLYRLEVDLGPQAGEELTLTVEYGSFNEIIIQAPEESR